GMPHSSATPDNVRQDWAVIERAAPGFGRKASDIRVVYSNFVHVLEKGARPGTAAPRFATFSGMDLEYWQEHYLLGEAGRIVDRINARIAAVDGRVDWVVLNPVDWDPGQLGRLAAEGVPGITAWSPLDQARATPVSLHGQTAPV